MVARASWMAELMTIKFRRNNKTAVLFYQSRLFLLFSYHRKQVYSYVALRWDDGWLRVLIVPVTAFLGSSSSATPHRHQFPPMKIRSAM